MERIIKIIAVLINRYRMESYVERKRRFIGFQDGKVQLIGLLLLQWM
jgi:hypothetical protein